MNFALFTTWFTLLIFSFIKNRDIFSPSKVFSVIFFTFFGKGFWDANLTLELFLCLMLLISLNIFFIIFESKRFPNFSTLSKVRNSGVVARIWLITVIPVAAQIYFINSFGGFELFVTSIGGRVQDWQGLGLVLALLKLMNVINYLYFIVLIKSPKTTKIDKILFFIHFSMFVIFGLLSGSRSTLLWNVVFMIVFYHYSVRPISIQKASIGFVTILMFAMAIGVAREGYKFGEDGVIESGIDLNEKILNVSNFQYGIQPLEKILELNEIQSPEYGLTYISAVTNLIPRVLWPGKPDSGGVVITEKYFGNPFGGYSNYTTGIIPEAVINFGFILGIFFSVGLMFFLCSCLMFFQGLCYQRYRSEKSALFLRASYPFFLFGIPSYIYAEFTTNTISMLIFKFSLFFLVFNFIFLKLKIKQPQ